MLRRVSLSIVKPSRHHTGVSGEMAAVAAQIFSETAPSSSRPSETDFDWLAEDFAAILAQPHGTDFYLHM